MLGSATTTMQTGVPVRAEDLLGRLVRARDEERAGDDRAKRIDARVTELMTERDPVTGQRRVLGDSAGWRDVLRQIVRVAPTATTVLITGESGTGKEVVARFLHRASSRDRAPFIAINCAALPEQLLEAELFGYERGAFTGATQSKPGQLEQAAGGTLFLDEVGEMTPTAQAKLLRVLQEREFQRLGGTRVLRSEARIVAATNRDLEQAVRNGAFREDLYYRLSVFPVRLPALRDRAEDILPLAGGFLASIARELGQPPAGISLDAREQLLEYHWPGNARELRNTLERAAILCDGGLITSDHLSLPVSAPSPLDPAPKALSALSLATMERNAIEQALAFARHNKSQAAKMLGLTRHQFYIRLRRHGIAV
jgi:transcriptional regulator with GAF, ATPase, and Fis domain